MGKIAALDIGDVWTGVALSDPLKIVAKPYATYPTESLHEKLRELCDQEQIELIVVGNPKTLRGTESEQTKRVHEIYQNLSTTFSEIPFVLWDERLSSKRAESLPATTSDRKQEKHHIHARAAAFILDTYLQAHHTL